ncbi:MAG: biotin--[acetyl-CoA-carboxylase] ligase [Ignavibacteriales bacterium]|nr:biotin--[acetyl-CoA-carboxylase] ligase [Ignavibacteriales bacterium]
MMTKNEITENLTTTVFAKSVYTFETIDSTNTFAKSLPQHKGPHGTLIIADEQTSGRGRMQREWISTKGKNLLFTLVFYPEFGMEKISLLPFVGSLAVTDAIETVTGLSATCKWPNDVLINNKKVCGMLLETSTGNSPANKVILGIGVNVNQEDFPEELKHKASSLKNESGIEIDRVRLLQKILEELENRYDQLSFFPPQQLLHDWRLKALLFGKKITVLESEFSFNATAIDVAEDGSLIIQTEDGQKRNIFAGDVSLAYN